MNVEQWLATVFTPMLVRDTLASSGDADALRGQLRALHDCEVLSDEAFALAQDRLDGAVDAVRRRAGLDVRPAATVAPAPMNMLTRVLAPAELMADVDAMTLVLTSVELWTHRIDLFLAGVPTADTERRARRYEADLNEWARKRSDGVSVEGTLSPPPQPGGRLLDLDVRLRDDVGTGYDQTIGSAGGTGTEWRMHKAFAPGLPDTATHLVVEIADSDGNVVHSLRLAT